MPQPPGKPFSGIFVSYRRDDSSGHAGRLFDHLVHRFGKDRIFMDIDTIEPGEDFVTVIENAVSSCEILLAIIGRDWLSEPGETTRRLDNPNDFVRVEIAAALNRDIRVIPVLVQRASMPRQEDLPDDLKKFTRRNAIELTDLRWQTDLDQLIAVMERVLAKREAAVQLAETARQSEEVSQREEDEKKRLLAAEKGRLEKEDEAKRRVAEERRREERAKLDTRETAGLQAGERVRPEAEAPLRESNPGAAYNQLDGPSTKITARGESIPAYRNPRVVFAVAALFVLVGAAVLIWRKQSKNDSPGKTNQVVATESSPATQPSLPKPGQTPAPANPTPAPGTGVRNAAGIEFVYVPPGSFMMGANNLEAAARPAHQVTLREGFYMGKYEVTQADWKNVMGTNPSDFKGNNLPVEMVSWLDVTEFVRKLNEMNHEYTYRLPTEAEWEYACRAGTTGDYAGNLDAMAWYDANSSAKTHPVGTKQPNAFGLYDMHGNVMEWCQDWYHLNYDGAPVDGSAWEKGGSHRMRVYRGGSWVSPAFPEAHSANRGYGAPDRQLYFLGFRLVAVARSL